MSVPVWLLDIDGVINAISKKGDPAVWHDRQTGTAHAGGTDWPILWSPTVVRFIREAHTQGRVEVRRHTTWQHEAAAIEDLVGLPRPAVAHAPEYLDRSFTARAIRDGAAPWWKLPAAERVVLEEKRPMIWTDDDIDYALRRHGRPEGLLICPKQHIGLTPKYLRQIAELW